MNKIDISFIIPSGISTDTFVICILDSIGKYGFSTPDGVIQLKSDKVSGESIIVFHAVEKQDPPDGQKE